MSDNSFSISTSQNVSIDYETVGVGERIFAGGIDFAIKLGYTLLVLYICDKLGITGDIEYLTIIFLLPALLYSLLFEVFMQGQTPGKRIRKIKVVKADGQAAGFSDYLIRWLFIFIDIYISFLAVGVFVIIFNKKHQRLGDIIAQTTVVRISNRISLKDAIYEKLDIGYQTVYHEVNRLSVPEVELIRKVLNTTEYRENYDILYPLTNKVQAKMNVSRTEAPEDFLRTVLKDYNSLAG